jgi:hypothetical protein
MKKGKGVSVVLLFLLFTVTHQWYSVRSNKLGALKYTKQAAKKLEPHLGRTTSLFLSILILI